jgi:peptidyl-prolyl cis-trans isomerase A (cyclophilin A)
MRMNIRILVVILLGCVAGPLSAAAQSGPANKAPAKASPAAAQAPAGSKAGPFDTALLDPATLREKAPDTYDVKVTTTAGDFVIRVTRAWAPIGADRFYNLVRHRFFDGGSFFRVLPGFVVQFGLSPYPEVSKVWNQATIKDDPVVQSNHKGYVTFATAGPNTRTTQLFINIGNNEGLDRMGFAAFGTVSNGMEVVEKLYSGYGEGAPQGQGPSQDLIQSRGRAYLEQGFPKLDSVKTAVVVPSAAPGPAAK